MTKFVWFPMGCAVWLWGAYYYPYLATLLFVLTVLCACVSALKPREVAQPATAWVNPATGDVVDRDGQF